MVKKKQIVIDGYSESPNFAVHDRRWSSALSAKSCAAILADSLFLPSINDLSNKTRCTVLGNFTFRNSIFPSDSLSGLISLSPSKTVSTFAVTSEKLGGGNHKVPV